MSLACCAWDPATSQFSAWEPCLWVELLRTLSLLGVSAANQGGAERTEHRRFYVWLQLLLESTHEYRCALSTQLLLPNVFFAIRACAGNNFSPTVYAGM